MADEQDAKKVDRRMDTMDMKHIGTGTDNSKLNIIFC